MKRYQVGIVGATGMVGQRFISLLENQLLQLLPALLGKHMKKLLEIAGLWLRQCRKQLKI